MEPQKNMEQFESIIAQIAVALSITSLDVYVFFSFLVIIGIIAALGLERIYSTFFGTVLGIGIYILFSTILSPEFQTPETLSLISDTFAKVLIGSSVYLVFILTILVPINGGIVVTLPKWILGKIFQTITLGALLAIFLLSVFLGLVEKSYIFVHTDSAFTLVKKFATYSELQSSLLFRFVSAHLPTIIILSIGFIIYKMLFSDITNALIASLIASIKKHQIKVWEHGNGWHGSHGGGAHEKHEEHKEEHKEAGHEEHKEEHGWGHGHH